MKKIKGLVRLMRLELPISAGICVIMGQLLALGHFASAFDTVSGFLSIVFISASILVLNDYFDVETDRINAPDRPIPSNTVTRTEALVFSISLVIAGIILSYLINTFAFYCAVILLSVGFLYNRIFKKSGLPGNLMVSFSVGMTFIYGGISTGLAYNKMVWFFGLIAGLIDLGEEIAADAMDMAGDSLIDSHSLAIKFGKRPALITSASIFASVILLTFIPFIFKWFRGIYLLPILIMDCSIAYSAYKLLISRNDEGRKYIRSLYLGSSLGLLIFLLMRLFESGS